MQGCSEPKREYCNINGVNEQVNNAGVNLLSHEYEKGLTMLNTNYFGVKNVTKALFPLLRSNSPAGARIVNVSSQLGLLEVWMPCHL